VSEPERDKWDERYRDGAYEGRVHPTALLASWLPQLRRGTALDVACGAGRNALFLAAAGFRVHALDISPVGLDRGRRDAELRGLDVRWLEADLDGDPDRVLPAESYDLIVWVRYVHRALFPFLAKRLAPEGYLLCEQHLVTTAEVVGPKTSAFRLEAGELRKAAAGLEIQYYYEGPVTDPDGRSVALTQLVARSTA
jgi:SAM-dependent methyltransferase